VLFSAQVLAFWGSSKYFTPGLRGSPAFLLPVPLFLVLTFWRIRSGLANVYV
jgi:hypothetical protein